MKNIILGIMIFGISINALAGYNANFVGKVTHVLTYTYSTQILIRVEGQPTEHPECGTLDYLAIDAETPDNIRQIVLSRLLIAYTTGQSINIGYDKEGGCVGNRIKVYRVG